MALTLGGRKRKIKRSDFNQLAQSLGISELVRDNIYKDFRRNADKVKEIIDHSFLTDDFKEKYVQIVHTKLKQIEL